MENDNCPVCENEGFKVNNKTVKHLVINHLSVLVKEDDHYFLCKDKQCEVVYFNQSKEILFYRDEIKVPVHFKKDAHPKYICYCNKITEQQIIDAIKNNNATNFKAVVNMTGAMNSCNCEINNPTGNCCAEDIKKIIKNTKK